jgi:cell division protein FtsB
VITVKPWGDNQIENMEATPGKIRFRRRAARALLAVMNVDLGIWSKLTKVVVGLVVLAFLLLIGMCYLPLIQQNERMRREILRLDAQLQKEEEKSRQLKTEIEALRNDPKTIERLMREKLGYARPDETVVRFEPATTNAPLR